MNRHEYITDSAIETVEIGKKFAKQLKKGDIVGLSGELGSGKTTLTQGIALGLGVKNKANIVSPSFVLIREYKDGRLPLYHIDLYRLDTVIDIERLGIEEYLYGDGVCVIEWAEKMKPLLPNRYLEVRMGIEGRNRRRIILKNLG